MKNSIKFRGRGLGSNKYVRGIGYPDSVAQFVGYNINGAEVYEGDKLIDAEGYIYTATIYDVPQVIATSFLREDVT